MKIGVRRSPHLEYLLEGMKRHGVTLTDEGDTGCDAWLCWGWPTARDITRKWPEWQRNKIILVVDAHPFALAPGARTGSRIIQINNWGALADYPPAKPEFTVPEPKDRSNPNGPVLVLGQVGTEQKSTTKEIDTWVTDGYEQWAPPLIAQPNTRFRPHPREWVHTHPGQRQPTLEEDLDGCSSAVSWNSTAAVHAQLLGYPATSAEAHGWAHMSLRELAGQERTIPELRSGDTWNDVKEYIECKTR